jgi:hypothetical protein
LEQQVGLTYQMEERRDMVDSKVIDAFHMMWGSFPEPVRLIHKDRKVLAVNEIAASRGMEVGVSCFSVGSPELHKVCGANEALASDQGQRMNASDGRIRFWSPVAPDVFIHFIIFRDPPQ